MQLHKRITTGSLIATFAFFVAGAATAEESAKFQIESPAFAQNEPIPPLYTCEGKDMSPPLTWSGMPAKAKSLALVVEDPDVATPGIQRGSFIHWLVYNLPAATIDLPEGAEPLPLGTREGVTNWKHSSYGGPCLATGKHRYFFKLYALDAMLKFEQPPNKSELEAAMKGHILGEAVLVGTFEKKETPPPARTLGYPTAP